jgi:hypothetical protein
MLVPALMGSMQLTVDLINGKTIWMDPVWLKLLLSFDILYTAASVVLIETVLVG